MSQVFRFHSIFDCFLDFERIFSTNTRKLSLISGLVDYAPIKLNPCIKKLELSIDFSTEVVDSFPNLDLQLEFTDENGPVQINVKPI
jgi:hypothetical protein